MLDHLFNRFSFEERLRVKQPKKEITEHTEKKT